MNKEVWIDGERYIRDNIPYPKYRVRVYESEISASIENFGPFHSLADATWQARCSIEGGARIVVIETLK